MNDNDNDLELINFIRQNRPLVPPSSPDLENKILQQVETQLIASLHKENILPRRHSSKHLRIWFVSSAVAAGLVAAVVSYRNIMLQPSAAELSNLEAFMENNWHGSFSNHPEDDVLQVTD